MAKKTKPKATPSTASSWWKERSKILAKKAESRPAKAKAKKRKSKKAKKAATGKTYYCEVCGCEMICVEPSAREIVCCDVPMLLAIE